MLIIIGSDKELTLTHADMFYYMGVLASAYSPEELSLSVTSRADAILVLDPICSGISAQRISEMTLADIYALSDEDCPGFSVTLPRESYAPGILNEINEHRQSLGKEALGVYRLFGIDASVNRGTTRLGDRVIDLTRTETMILRYLIHSYPRQVSAEEVLAHAFKATRAPEQTSVRTHISIINRKFRALTGSPLTRGGITGYCIDPEMLRDGATADSAAVSLLG